MSSEKVQKIKNVFFGQTPTSICAKTLLNLKRKLRSSIYEHNEHHKQNVNEREVTKSCFHMSLRCMIFEEEIYENEPRQLDYSFVNYKRIFIRHSLVELFYPEN